MLLLDMFLPFCIQTRLFPHLAEPVWSFSMCLTLNEKLHLLTMLMLIMHLRVHLCCSLQGKAGAELAMQHTFGEHNIVTRALSWLVAC